MTFPERIRAVVVWSPRGRGRYKVEENSVLSSLFSHTHSHLSINQYLSCHCPQLQPKLALIKPDTHCGNKDNHLNSPPLPYTESSIMGSIAIDVPKETKPTFGKDANSREYAQSLDAKCHMRSFREKFIIPSKANTKSKKVVRPGKTHFTPALSRDTYNVCRTNDR
jgi:hypothetical protein